MDRVKHHLVQVAEANKHSANSQSPTITAALLETYSRLLIWLGTRNFQSKKMCSDNNNIPHIISSSFDTGCIQESGMASTSCFTRSHCLSCPFTTSIFLSISTLTTITYCSWCIHYTYSAFCLVSHNYYAIVYYVWYI